MRVALHEYDAVAREALRYHAQLQRVTQFVLLTVGVGAPLAFGSPAVPSAAGASAASWAVLPSSLVLLAFGCVFLVLAATFVAYFRALVVNMSYRWVLGRKVSRLLGDDETLGADGPFGYRQYVENWYRPPGSASNVLLQMTWGVQFVFPYAIGTGCLWSVLWRDGLAVFSLSAPLVCGSAVVSAFVWGVATFCNYAFWEFRQMRRQRERKVIGDGGGGSAVVDA